MSREPTRPQTGSKKPDPPQDPMQKRYRYHHNYDCNRNDPKCAACREGWAEESKGEAMKATRAEVYEAIDGEREYQDQRWHKNSTPSEGQHETAAFLTYIREYLGRAELLASECADDTVAPGGHRFARETALDMVRKVTALGVACMEQNGAPKR